jgi:hypothetical protein
MSETNGTELQRIINAREDDYLLHIDAYCESTKCPGRAFEIQVKDHDRALADLIRRRGLTCPVCGTKNVSIHDVRTSEDDEARDEQQARASVNRQMYERDHVPHDDGFRLVGIPLDVFVDDRLPPTPPDWWTR